MPENGKSTSSGPFSKQVVTFQQQDSFTEKRPYSKGQRHSPRLGCMITKELEGKGSSENVTCGASAHSPDDCHDKDYRLLPLLDRQEVREAIHQSN